MNMCVVCSEGWGMNMCAVCSEGVGHEYVCSV